MAFSKKYIGKGKQVENMDIVEVSLNMAEIQNHTSQLPVSAWYEIIGDQTLADAILYRIVHDAHRIELKGESLRRNRNINPENQ